MKPLKLRQTLQKKRTSQLNNGSRGCRKSNLPGFPLTHLNFYPKNKTLHSLAPESYALDPKPDSNPGPCNPASHKPDRKPKSQIPKSQPLDKAFNVNREILDRPCHKKRYAVVISGLMNPWVCFLGSIFRSLLSCTPIC